MGINAPYAHLVEELTARQLVLDGDVYEEYLLHSITTLEEDNYITKISVLVRTST